MNKNHRNIKNCKVVVRDIRKYFPNIIKKEDEENFLTSSAKIPKPIKQEEEVKDDPDVKKDPDEIFLFTYEKMPKGKVKREVTKFDINNGHPHKTTYSKHQCEVCKKYLKSSQSLKQHTERHYRPKNECKECNRTFHNGFKLKHHTCVPINLVCLHCNLQLRSVKSLKFHLNTVHKPRCEDFVCDYCGENFRTKLLFRYHVIKCSGAFFRKYFCDHCDRTFFDKTRLGQHLLAHAVHKVECEVCHIMVRPGVLKHHIQRYHPKITESFECKKCLKTFKTKRVLKLHEKIHGEKFKCQFCTNKFPDKGQLKFHMKVHENPEALKCKICGHQSTRKEHLQTHLKTHQTIREKHLKCTRCDFKTEHRNSFNHHLKVHEKLDEKLKLPGAIQCSQCIAVLKNKMIYGLHVKKQHQDRIKFECDVCGKAFTIKTNLKAHIMRTHFSG